MTHCNYYHLVFKKVTKYHFVIVILAKQDYTGGTESGSGTLPLLLLGGIIVHRKSKFGLRHAIKLIKLYSVTKSEF